MRPFVLQNFGERLLISAVRPAVRPTEQEIRLARRALAGLELGLDRRDDGILSLVRDLLDPTALDAPAPTPGLIAKEVFLSLADNRAGDLFLALPRVAGVEPELALQWVRFFRTSRTTSRTG